MHTFKLQISSPSGDAFFGDAVMLALRGAEGDLAILADHAPFITSVQPGELHVDLPDEAQLHFKTAGGLLTVTKEQVTLLIGHYEKI